MGCGGSKEEDVYAPIGGFNPQAVQANKAAAAAGTGAAANSNTPQEPPKLDKKTTQKINDIKKQISAIHTQIQTKVEANDSLRTERIGMECMMLEERLKVRKMEELLLAMTEERTRLLNQTFERDVEVINEALTESRADKASLIGVFVNRTKYELEQISALYEKKHSNLIEDLQGKLTTTFGSITGANTGLCNLLVYRATPQAPRDAQFINEYATKQQDDALIEVFATRTNEELRKAIEYHNLNNEQSVEELFKLKCSYANYKTFMIALLDCKRDETFDTLEDYICKDIADVLFEAAGGRVIGADPLPFIRHFSVINHAQFVCINNKYPKKALFKDIEKKFGGSFEKAMKAMASDPFELLAERIFEGDKDTITRVLGCTHRHNMEKLKEAYIKCTFKKTIDEVLKNNMKGHFLLACNALLSNDMSMSPTGSFREPWQDLATIVKEGNRAMVDAQKNFRQDKLQSLGENCLAGTFQITVPKSNADTAVAKAFEAATWDPKTCLKSYDAIIDSIPNVNKGGFYPDLAKLQILLQESAQALQRLEAGISTMADELEMCKQQYFSLAKLSNETEGWTRIYQSHLSFLRNYVPNRDSIITNSLKKYSK